jgi:ubiquinone/menaquinone biosynthesis C-methylase UbiE
MKIEQAIDLLSGVEGKNKPNQHWADLGSGDGLFTVALANLLGKDSIIHAVDTNQKSLSSIPDLENFVTIEKHKLDFVQRTLPFGNLDGILMANSFHFVKDQTAFIHKLQNHLATPHQLIFVEYDMDKANTWVPYPLSFSRLEKLFRKLNYKSIEKLHAIPSIYNRAEIYSAIVRVS